MIIKKGQVITFDIKYGGEPEPEVKWMKGEEVNISIFIKSYFTNQVWLEIQFEKLRLGNELLKD